MEKFINFPGEALNNVSLYEQVTEYPKLKEKVAALVMERTRLRVKVGKLTAERDRWMSNAHGAQALSLEYLRERDRYREVLKEILAEVTHALDREEEMATAAYSGADHSYTISEEE